MPTIPNNTNARFARKAGQAISRISDADPELEAQPINLPGAAPGREQTAAEVSGSAHTLVDSQKDISADTHRRNPRRSVREKTGVKQREPGQLEAGSSRKPERTVKENRHRPYTRTVKQTSAQDGTMEVYLHDRCRLPSCSEPLSTENPARKHFTDAHGIKAGNVSRDGLTYECQWAGCEAKLDSSILRHMVEHVVRYPCPVEECGVSYTRASNLKRHMQDKHSADTG